MTHTNARIIEKQCVPTREMLVYYKGKSDFDHAEKKVENQINVVRSRDTDVQAMRVSRCLVVNQVFWSRWSA